MMAATSNASGDGALNDDQANVGIRYLEEEVSSGFVNITENVIENEYEKKSRAKKKTSSSTYVQGHDDQVNEHGAVESFAIQPDIGVGGQFAIQPNIGDGGHLAFQPYMGVGGQFAIQPNIGDGGHLAFHPYMGVGGQFGFQGYENPFWKVAHGFTSTQSSTSRMGQGQGNCTDGYEKDVPSRCSGDDQV